MERHTSDYAVFQLRINHKEWLRYTINALGAYCCVPEVLTAAFMARIFISTPFLIAEDEKTGLISEGNAKEFECNM